MRSYTICVRMSHKELQMLDRIARAIGKSRSDAIRLCLLFVDIYLTRELSLIEVMKPLPEVIEYVLEKQKSEEEH